MEPQRPHAYRHANHAALLRVALPPTHLPSSMTSPHAAYHAPTTTTMTTSQNVPCQLVTCQCEQLAALRRRLASASDLDTTLEPASDCRLTHDLTTTSTRERTCTSTEQQNLPKYYDNMNITFIFHLFTLNTTVMQSKIMAADTYM